jgi:hypothetical protein
MTLVENEDEMLDAITVAIKANKVDGAVLIEEKLSGPEVAVDWLMIDGTIRYVNGVYRFFRHHKPGSDEKLFGIESAIINPFVPNTSIEHIDNTLIIQAENTARRLGVLNGPFKTDAIFDERYGWCILECATRWSGGWDSSFLAPMIDRNIMKVLLDWSLGLEVETPPVNSNIYAASYVPYYKPMNIKEWKWVESYDEIKKKYRISNVFVRSTNEIKNLSNCAERPIFFLSSGNSPLDAFRNAYRASRYFVPIGELDGDNNS